LIYQWDFRFLLNFVPGLLKGLGVTLYISVLSIFLGTILGILIALAQKSKSIILRGLALVYINVFLSLPVLVLLVWFYYCLPVLIPLKLSSQTTAIFTLTLSLGGFIADIVRGGIDSLPQGQLESALILGIPRSVAMKRIMLPQAIRVMVPAILGQYVTCIKLSSLASIIAVYELVHTANSINLHSFRPLETYTIVALLYFIIIWPLIVLMRYLEDKYLIKRTHKGYEKDISKRYFRWRNA